MVVLNKIYTKTGDDGSTGLGNGERRKKYDLRVSSYGTVDETNSCIGLARLHTNELPDMDEALARIQNDLFDLGADLATQMTANLLNMNRYELPKPKLSALETEIDALNAKLDPLRSFVLPGGTALSANLHLARTIARRAERLIVELAEDDKENISKAAVLYMNRISDYLFVSARAANDLGKADVLWVPGQKQIIYR